MNINCRWIASLLPHKTPVERRLFAQLFGIASRYVEAKSKALALHIQEQKGTRNCVFFTI
jgi:hypothetical protein